MKVEARIGKYKVDVRDHSSPSLVYFTSGVHGPGKGESGIFCFWTAVFKRPFQKRRCVWGRATVDLQPGDRFDRMKREMRTAPSREDRKVYRKWYVEAMRSGGNVSYVRPSTPLEIGKWMATHAGDAKFAKWMKVGK